MIRQTNHNNKFQNQQKIVIMKPLFILSLIFSSFFTTTAFAKDGENSAAQQSFNTTFTNAAEVKWTVSEGLHKVSFSLNGQYAAAFYNEEGELIATTRNFTSLQLPITLQASLKKDHAGFWITDLFEVTTQASTEYYVTLENAEQKVILKASPNSTWSKHQKIRKI